MRDSSRPFSLATLGRSAGPLDAAIERVLGLEALNLVRWNANAQSEHPIFSARCLEHLRISWHINELRERLADRAGKPTLIVANHPFGGVEGMVLDAAVREQIPDAKLLVTTLLAAIPEFKDTTLALDNLTKQSAAKNANALKSALRHLKAGGTVVAFPGGEVAAWQWRTRTVVEPPWPAALLAIGRRVGATAIPVFFEGHNSVLFHAIGAIHPTLRTLRLPREITNKRGSAIRGHAGSPIDLGSLPGSLSDQAAAEMLRDRCLNILAGPHSAQQPLAEPEPPEELVKEIGALPPDRTLASLGPLRVVMFRADEAPALLREVGRVRELSFREVREGTGKPADLDRFDRTYIQLVVWDAERSLIAGGYRMGATDELLEGEGIDGLYCATLFKFKPRLLDQISPALELGRSFVHPEYQRQHAPLMLLWRGIGSFIANNPRYQRLFGPVSISADYSSISRDLLVRFLTQHAYLPRLGRLLRPRNPPPPPSKKKRAPMHAASDLDQVNKLIREVEHDGKPMPVLLRQYLKLNAKLLAFNIDPDFGGVLDGLMLVDLTTVDPRVLSKYMGTEQAERFLAHAPEDGQRRSGRASRRPIDASD